MKAKNSSATSSPEQDKEFAEALGQSVSKELARVQKSAKPLPPFPPPDSGRLKLVWRLWHLLPNDWAAETRIRLLVTPAPEIPRLRQWYAENARRLAANRKLNRRPSPVREAFWREFSGQFNARDAATFEAARWWDWFLGQFQKVFAFTTQKDGTRLYDRLIYVKQQVAFGDFLMHNERDVATYRTTHELQIAHPEFWKISAPALDLVKKARDRWEAYETARLRATQVFHKLIVPKPLSIESLRRAAQHPLLSDRKKLVDHLAGDFWKLKLYKQEDFIKDVFQPLRQHYEDFANYIACDAVAPDTLRNFMGEDFLKLTQQQKLHFVKLCAQRRPRRKTEQYIILKTWLLDNAPVFQEFRWSLAAVLNAVAHSFRHYPGDSGAGDGLRVFQSALHDWGILLNLVKGRSSQTHLRGQHPELLTSPPFFVIKQP